ncbi:iron ABC transporter substrate-binding protein [Pacificitalea manganoxidans]|uniref:Iron ABC transporter substrate-binding protein n=1 Tax=Pacificitalea manganoxidans TaxID=1411902 RepID=A0A291LX34_9RHOB|nr:metal ABC transporter substrate-binding protein [Pacificitalea manganoxidans]ATI41058.1 iron ABC transporter substrate-binding protein [Pacificitalea manganoxidans]MDR6308424.1 manganese/iron transport system substrate-binding protein [Pacificitalea manganoxidans]
MPRQIALPLIRSLLAAMALAIAATLPARAADDAPRLKVATTFTVIADMARNVAGDLADVVSITKPGAEIHNYQPTPRDILSARDADLVLWNGLNLELWFAQFFENMGEVPSVVISDGVEPIGIGEGPYSGKPNPHAWMALSGAEIYVDNIARALAEHDPDNAAAYRANAESYKARIAEALAPLRARIEAIPTARRWLVTSEGAFSYLARDFGMQELYLWPINADGQGTPQQVRRVIDAVRAHDIPAVFSESTVSARPAEQIARETGARYGGVLYVDSLSAADGPVPTYLDLLRVTVETIAQGLEQ